MSTVLLTRNIAGPSCPKDGQRYQINHYPMDEYQGQQLHCPMDKDSPNGLCNPAFEQLGPVPDTGVGSDFRITVWFKGKQNWRQNA